MDICKRCPITQLGTSPQRRPTTGRALVLVSPWHYLLAASPLLHWALLPLCTLSFAAAAPHTLMPAEVKGMDWGRAAVRPSVQPGWARGVGCRSAACSVHPEDLRITIPRGWCVLSASARPFFGFMRFYFFLTLSTDMTFWCLQTPHFVGKETGSLVSRSRAGCGPRPGFRQCHREAGPSCRLADGKRRTVLNWLPRRQLGDLLFGLKNKHEKVEQEFQGPDFSSTTN